MDDASVANARDEHTGLPALRRRAGAGAAGLAGHDGRPPFDADAANGRRVRAASGGLHGDPAKLGVAGSECIGEQDAISRFAMIERVAPWARCVQPAVTGEHRGIPPEGNFRPLLVLTAREKRSAHVVGLRHDRQARLEADAVPQADRRQCRRARLERRRDALDLRVQRDRSRPHHQPADAPHRLRVPLAPRGDDRGFSSLCGGRILVGSRELGARR